MGAYLEANDLGEFAALFKKCGINGELFLALTMEDLVDMGLDNAFVRKQILKKVAKLNGLLASRCRRVLLTAISVFAPNATEI